MECDSMHSAIEKRLRNQEIYTPAGFLSACKKARTSPKPYSVEHLLHTDLRDFSKLKYFTTIRLGFKVGDATVNNLCALKYTPDGMLFFKINFDDDWTQLIKRHSAAVMGTEDIPCLYRDSLPIKKSKYDHLQDLKKISMDELVDHLPFTLQNMTKAELIENLYLGDGDGNIDAESISSDDESLVGDNMNDENLEDNSDDVPVSDIFSDTDSDTEEDIILLKDLQARFLSDNEASPKIKRGKKIHPGKNLARDEDNNVAPTDATNETVPVNLADPNETIEFPTDQASEPLADPGTSGIVGKKTIKKKSRPIQPRQKSERLKKSQTDAKCGLCFCN
ncbi:unnamed protein product [Phaedon cochleariae]|uniref:Uncharacterized protein n=1 Tax=Phaedon cochleariae TaxID=80249 RepID=A0A9P0GQ42_PHACE|nr:unnamed protein product [Phaedon cochleariae]